MEGLRHYFASALGIPFILMIVVVALSSSLQGLKSGFMSATIWVLYLIYDAFFPLEIKVVPQDFAQVSLDIAAIVLLVMLQGRKKLNGDRMIRFLHQSCDQLTSVVDRRTQELDEANTLLRQQICERELVLNRLRQTELDLRQSEARLLLALEASNMGIWDWDIVTEHITWSSGHEQLFGLAPNTFDGRYETFDRCLHPDDRTRLNQAVGQAIQERTTYSLDCR
jgi:PAS domain-containing protein